MDTQNLMKIIVSAIIGVVVFAAILVPVVGDATTTEKTFTNEGLVNMTQIDDSVSTTIEWDYTNPTVLTIDGEDSAMPQDYTFPITTVGTDEFFIRYERTMVTVFHDSTVVFASVSAATNMTITISEGTITSTNGTNTDTFTFTDGLFIIDSEGEWVLKNPNDSAYVLKDDEIYGYGRSSLTNIGGNCNFNVTGTIEDGFVAEPWGTNSTLTVSDYVVTATANETYVDLYEFTSVAFKVTDGTSTDAVTYSQVIVPVEVTAELSVHPGTSEIALLNIIPLLVLVGLVLGVVGAVLARRD